MSRQASLAALVHRRPYTSIFITALTLRLLTHLLLRLCVAIQGDPFDSSHLLVTHDAVPAASASETVSSVSLRWDAIHFVSIAREGYRYEQLLAFQPGWPVVIRYASLLARLLPGQEGSKGVGERLSVDEVVRTGEVLASLSYAGAACMLFKLTNTLFDRRKAWATTLSYLLPPSPAVMSSPYGEPLYALLVFTGYYLCTKRRFWLASVVLAGATSIRATGVVNVGVLGWCALFGQQDPREVMQRPSTVLRRAAGVVLPALVVSPFVISQIHWYQQFCPSNTLDGRPEWCSNRLPLVYTYVQEKYWNVGLLNYWTPAQLPNLLIAAPILSASLHGCYRFFTPPYRFPTVSHAQTAKPKGMPAECDHGQYWRLMPFYTTHLALTFLLAFSAHSQIALRLSVTDPIIWWTVADLAIAPSTRTQDLPQQDDTVKEAVQAEASLMAGRPAASSCETGAPRGQKELTGFGRAWVWWVVVYGGIGIPLWAGHYPPA